MCIFAFTTNPFMNNLLPKLIQKTGCLQNMEREGADGRATVHTLRHSGVYPAIRGATHLPEADIDLKQIQQDPGHRSLKNTIIYPHITDLNPCRSFSTIDQMEIE
jgi:site-specific recombinase XerD